MQTHKLRYYCQGQRNKSIQTPNKSTSILPVLYHCRIKWGMFKYYYKYGLIYFIFKMSCRWKGECKNIKIFGPLASLHVNINFRSTIKNMLIRSIVGSRSHRIHIYFQQEAKLFWPLWCHSQRVLLRYHQFSKVSLSDQR